MKKIVFAVLCMALVGCDFNTTRTNLASDRDRAVAVSDKLFDCLEHSNYECADKLFSKEFFEATPKDSLHEIYRISRDVLGEFKVRTLEEWETSVVSGTNPVAEFLLLYNVEYTKHPAQVALFMVEEEGEVKIKVYRILSDAFDK